MIAPIRPALHSRASGTAHRAAVLDAARALLARGEVPTAERLGREAGISRDRARVCRAELVAAGELVLPEIKTGPKPGRPAARGLDGETAAEREQIHQAYLAALELRREKQARAKSFLFQPRLARIGHYAGSPDGWQGGDS